MKIITEYPVVHVDEFNDDVISNATGRKVRRMTRSTKMLRPKRRNMLKKQAPTTGRRVNPNMQTKEMRTNPTVKRTNPNTRPKKRRPPINVKTTLPNPSVSQTNIEQNAQTGEKKKMSMGMKIGIGVGIAVVLGVIGYMVFKKKK